MIEKNNKIIKLLKDIISIPSISRNEKKVSDFLFNYLNKKNYKIYRNNNNIWCVYNNFDTNKKNILLNSHIDTVSPSKSWTYKPYVATHKDDKIYGLGSNDAGASVVSLINVFEHYARQKISYNLILLLSAEEEITGINGAEAVMKDLPKIDFAIVGEPTQMKMAVAEKGLLVLDCYATGKSGHVAHANTENAIYKAVENINTLKNIKFEKKSDFLGDIKINVTQIDAGQSHNVVPDECHFVVDVRVNEKYSVKEAFEIIAKQVNCRTIARSFRLNSSAIDIEHKLVKTAGKMGITIYGSNTTSDQTRMNFPSVKMGPGNTKRSHTADEYIYINEILSGIKIYINLLDNFFYETLG